MKTLVSVILSVFDIGFCCTSTSAPHQEMIEEGDTTELSQIYLNGTALPKRQHN